MRVVGGRYACRPGSLPERMSACFPHWQLESQRGCGEKSDRVQNNGKLHFQKKKKKRGKERINERRMEMRVLTGLERSEGTRSEWEVQVDPREAPSVALHRMTVFSNHPQESLAL